MTILESMKLFIDSESLPLHHEELWSIDFLHIGYDLSSHHTSYRLPLCDTDIEEIFLKRELTIFDLEFSNIISFGSILIQDPYVVHSEYRYKKAQHYIHLCKWEPKILTSSLPFWEKWNMSFFSYEDVRIHTELWDDWVVDFLYDSELRTPTSRIIVYFFLSGNYRFFGIFCKLRFLLYLSCDWIDTIFEMSGEYLLHETIFEWMESDNHDDSSWAKQPECLIERLLYMSEFIIHSDTQRLKYSKRGFLVEARRAYDLKKLESSMYRGDFPSLHDLWSDEPWFLLFSISREYTSKLRSIERHHEITRSTSLRPIESHIERSIEPQRESSISLIKMDTAHSEIIEYDVHTLYTFWLKSFLEGCEAQWEIFLLYMRGDGAEVYFCLGEILTISIESYEYAMIHLSTQKSRMSAKSERRIDDDGWGIERGEYLENWRKEYWRMKWRKQDEIRNVIRRNVGSFIFLSKEKMSWLFRDSIRKIYILYILLSYFSQKSVEYLTILTKNVKNSLLWFEKRLIFSIIRLWFHLKQKNSRKKYVKFL